MHLVVTGMLNKQIAVDLGISEKTVKVHRARVMEKTGSRSLAELVRRGLEELVSREPADKPWMAYAGIVDGEEDERRDVLPPIGKRGDDDARLGKRTLERWVERAPLPKPG